jgi:hypothetical protein
MLPLKIAKYKEKIGGDKFPPSILKKEIKCKHIPSTLSL